jgi:lipoprotein-anchoring transpeptidase ErfK/SrfK
VLDAFFAEDKFADDLKSKLQLSDDQINKLKTIARQQTMKLRENENADFGRATAARDEAHQQIVSAIGEEKSRELIAFVNERWNGGAAPAASTASSAAPQDTRIVVNTPAFRMDVFEDGRLIKTYKIGIGYPEFPLPKGLRKADTIIFNPTWTPPDEPWVEAGNSKFKVGEKVAAGDKANPLGPIKIPIGLPSLIHGGKAPAKLGNFASHGCVGLTSRQVEDFARLLARLSGTQITDEQIASYEKDKSETKPVKLKSAVPVELRYDTITVEDGKLHVYRDVYDRGTNTEENLRNVLQQYGVNFDQLSADKRNDVLKAIDQMARDALGKPATESSEPKAKSSSAKVTRTIKGNKEIVIDIPELAGKGYPSPVDMDDGGVSRQKPAGSRRRR